MFSPGPVEIAFIAGVFLLLFGAKKLPGLGGAIGEFIKNFKSGVREDPKIDGDSKSDQQQNSDSQ